MLTRRHFMAAGGAALLTPLAGRLSLAAAAGDNRLVVVILRGGMDGLDVVRPVGDPAFAALRPDAMAEANVALDGRFAMHPALADLSPLFTARELSFIHAVATPYRNRSHFEGQDILEQGGTVDGLGDGWLNRLLQLVPDAHAVDISAGDSMLLTGKMPVKNWYPDTRINLAGDSLQFLQMLYAGDPQLAGSLAEVVTEKAAGMQDAAGDPGISDADLARLAARFLNGDARIAAFSITGWDTHINQQPRLARLLASLAKTIIALRDGLGGNWKRTAVVMCSEFGRTARINGSGGTDHGTGGLAILAGGLLASGAGGRVLGRWPGLADLYEDRDLQPTTDVRRYLGSLASELYRLKPARVADVAFPGLDLATTEALL
jgi:uncharacterized protein (DUF1501 family)